jgi:hypothetical protein
MRACWQRLFLDGSEQSLARSLPFRTFASTHGDTTFDIAITVLSAR